MENNNLKERMHVECLRRLAALQLKPEVRENFRKGTLSCGVPLFGGAQLSMLTPDQEAKVRELEEKYGIMVYYAIRSRIGWDRHDCYLYVSEDADEWCDAYHDLLDGYPIAYVDNVTDPICSEFGGIGLDNINGVVIRVS